MKSVRFPAHDVSVHGARRDRLAGAAPPAQHRDARDQRLAGDGDRTAGRRPQRRRGGVRWNCLRAAAGAHGERRVDHGPRGLDAGALLPGDVPGVRGLSSAADARAPTSGRSCCSSSLSSPSRTPSPWWRRSQPTTSSSGAGRSGRSSAFVLPYVPFALMTAGYLWLRYLLFHEVAREGALNARALEDFRILLDRHLRHVVGGSLDAPAVVVWLLLALVGAAWLLLRRAPAPKRGLRRATCSTSGPYGGRLACCRSPWPDITRRGTCISQPSAGRSFSALSMTPPGRHRASPMWQRGVRIAAAARRCLLPCTARALRSRVEQDRRRFAAGSERRPYGSAGRRRKEP